MTTALHTLLNTAGALQPSLYINGPYPSVDGLPVPASLHAALIAVAVEAGRPDVVRHLQDLGKPRCLEPLDGTGASFCAALVKHDGQPCLMHSPANAAAFGLCSNTLRPHDGAGDNPQRGAEQRMCPCAPTPGGELCAWHEDLCRVRVNRGRGRVCARYRCPIPAHQR